MKNVPSTVMIGTASLAGLSAAAYLTTVSPMLVVGLAIGIASVTATRLTLKKFQCLQDKTKDTEEPKVFSQALAAAKEENNASVLPEHDMRKEAIEKQQEVKKDEAMESEAVEPTTYRIRITHPNASNMVH